ncbi:hypothetical protein MST22_04810 [Virgibacillus halodenitrificans]|uniref:Uncharacterized protein n=1 Tax=Virgibacillus halodenitrificans TaxID=1482 RepID=A0ABR7VJ87_VIRHA|nr:hypothetical protein [Virgibacillus halodenitrificans]MBD1221982.1 hypothetical protein [Virgibacillus halodenitrificans]MCJ0930469.1 hypothetical protein [Virgibacillus halodenitrificans]
MPILQTLFILYIVTFLLMFIFIYRSNRQETGEENMGLIMVTMVSALLALAPTVLFAIILFALVGSANVVDTMFSLHVDITDIIFFSIGVLIYLFTIDSIIEAIVKYLVGKTSFDHAIILLTRVGAFYFIGLLIGLDQTSCIVIGGGVAIFILALELLFKLRENNRKEK